MNKKIIIVSLLAIIALLGLSVLGKGNKSEKTVLSTNQSVSPAVTTVPTEAEIIPADKIEVVHFHATQQCWSCLTVGEYALKTIKEKFPEEYTSGKIIFKDINGELKENQEIVVKYQARGSSLFVNVIRGDKDDIAEDTTVWRLVNSESQFVNYFERKLSSLLGQ